MLHIWNARKSPKQGWSCANVPPWAHTRPPRKEPLRCVKMWGRDWQDLLDAHEESHWPFNHPHRAYETQPDTVVSCFSKQWCTHRAKDSSSSSDGTALCMAQWHCTVPTMVTCAHFSLMPFWMVYTFTEHCHVPHLACCPSSQGPGLVRYSCVYPTSRRSRTIFNPAIVVSMLGGVGAKHFLSVLSVAAFPQNYRPCK